MTPYRGHTAIYDLNKNEWKPLNKNQRIGVPSVLWVDHIKNELNAMYNFRLANNYKQNKIYKYVDLTKKDKKWLDRDIMNVFDNFNEQNQLFAFFK